MSEIFQNTVFEEKWHHIEELMEEFSTLNILPIVIDDGKCRTTISIDTLRENLINLHDQTFTIAVCGSVKAGKSTLLNAIFFGKNVLPVFDTPMTAKLTFLEYSPDKTGFEAEFYNKEEWKKIHDSLQGQSRNEFEERLRFCAETYGIYQGSCIDAIPIHRNDLNDLAEFVSVPRKSSACCGKYTPFVKLVRIHLPFENLKNICIVDTPGLNDANVINSIQTTEWVSNAHAIVYVLDVAGPRNPDINFFQHYFPSDAAEARIFVQNKIDTDENYRNVRKKIKEYGTEDIYKELGMFGQNETVCSYSGLMALAKRKITAGLPLTTEEALPFGFDWIGDDFDPDPDHIANVISFKLYQNAGIIRIGNARGKFINYALEKKRQLLFVTNEKKALAEACLDSRKKRESKCRNLRDFQNEVNDRNEQMKKDNDTSLTVYISELNSKVNTAHLNIEKIVSRRLESLIKIDQVRTQTVGIFSQAVRAEYNKLPNEVARTKGKIFELMNNNKQTLRDFACEHSIYDDFIGAEYIDDDYTEIWEKINDINSFSSKLKGSLPGFFENIVTTMETVRGYAKACVSKELQIMYDNFKDICDELKSKARDGLNKYSSNVANWAASRAKDIEKLEIELGEDHNRREILLAESAALLKESQKIEAFIVAHRTT